jgi:DNA repair exonuclease SbcCD ATPase subunit
MADKTLVTKLVLDNSEAKKSVRELKDDLAGTSQQLETIASKTPDTPIKSLKAQLKEAKNNLNEVIDRFGALSPEAANAAKSVARIEDKIGDAKKLSDAFNPDAKFKGLSSAIQGAVGGFTALQGAQALFGDKSKDLEKTLVKVQGALALSQGINSVLEAKDSFIALGAQAKAALNGIRTAIGSTGIGLLVIGVGLLAANFDKVKEVVSKLIPGLQAVASFIGNLVNKITDFIGITSEAGRATDKLIKDNEKAIKDSERFLDLNADKYDEYTQRKLKANVEFKKKQNEFLQDESLTESQRTEFIKQAREKANREILAADKDRNDKAAEERKKEADKEAADAKAAAERKAQLIADAEAVLQEARKSLLSKRAQEEYDVNADFEEKKKKLIAAGITDFTDIEREKAAKLAEINDAYRLQEEEKQKQHLEKLNELENTTFDIQTQNRLNQIQDRFVKEQEQLELQYQKQIDDAVKILDDKNLSEEERLKQYNERRAAIDEQYNQQKQLIQFNQADAALQKQIESDNASYEAKVQALDAEQLLLDEAYKNKSLSDDQYTAATKKNSETRTKIETIEKDKKKKLQQESIQLLKDFSNVIGAQTKAGKAAAKAALIIENAKAVATQIKSTKEAVMKDIAAFPLTNGLPWSALHIAQGALSVAQTIKATKDGIAQINSAGENSTPTEGGGAAAGGGAGAAPPAPAAPEQTIIPQEQINQITSANATTRAYVVESEVSTNQERAIRLNRAARIN